MICLSVSGPVVALLSHLSGSGGPEGGSRRSAEPIRSQSFSLPANHREAPKDSRGDHRRPVLPEPGESRHSASELRSVQSRHCVSESSHLKHWKLLQSTLKQFDFLLFPLKKQSKEKLERNFWDSLISLINCVVSCFTVEISISHYWKINYMLLVVWGCYIVALNWS